jgi:hypothetical protein
MAQDRLPVKLPEVHQAAAAGGVETEVPGPAYVREEAEKGS